MGGSRSESNPTTSTVQQDQRAAAEGGGVAATAGSSVQIHGVETGRLLDSVDVLTEAGKQLASGGQSATLGVLSLLGDLRKAELEQLGATAREQTQITAETLRALATQRAPEGRQAPTVLDLAPYLVAGTIVLGGVYVATRGGRG